MSEPVWWTEEKVALLRQYWDQGLTGSQIGRIFGTTKSAVIGAARRHKLSSRASPINSHPKKRVPKERVAKPRYSRALGPAEIAPLPWEEPALDREPVVRVAQTRPPMPVEVKLPPEEVGSPCRWPMIGHVDKDGRPILTKIRRDPRPLAQQIKFCDAPSKPGCSYCQKHWEMSRARPKSSPQAIAA